MTFAIIATGGKQYKAVSGGKLKIEKIAGEKGDTISFNEVLLHDDGEKTVVGTPHVIGKKVTATIVRQARDKKKMILKYHSKTRQSRTKGHRQQFTEVVIEAV